MSIINELEKRLIEILDKLALPMVVYELDVNGKKLKAVKASILIDRAVTKIMNSIGYQGEYYVHYTEDGIIITRHISGNIEFMKFSDMLKIVESSKQVMDKIVQKLTQELNF